MLVGGDRETLFETDHGIDVGVLHNLLVWSYCNYSANRDKVKYPCSAFAQARKYCCWNLTEDKITVLADCVSFCRLSLRGTVVSITVHRSSAITCRTNWSQKHSSLWGRLIVFNFISTALNSSIILPSLKNKSQFILQISLDFVFDPPWIIKLNNLTN